MSAPPYQKLFWGSYHKHTAHLGHAREHGAYLLLIGALWNNEGRLPADDATLAGYAKLSLKEWEAIKAKLINGTLLKIVRGKLTQPRVTEDLAKYRDTSGKRKEAGRTGGTVSAEKKRENRQAIATDLPTKPEPEPESKKEAIASSVGSASPEPTALALFSEEPSEPAGKPEPWAKDPHFALAWKACTDKGRTRSSRAKAWPAWKAALKVAPGPALAEAVARYVANDADAKRTGGPGFHIWLNDAKFEHWLVADSAAPEIDRPRFSGPPELRDRILAQTDPDFVAKWIDPAGWDPTTRSLVARTGYGAKEIERRLRTYLAEKKITVAVAGQTATPQGVAA